jgi:hypothetical protein
MKRGDMKIVVVSLSDTDLKKKGLPDAELFNLLDDNDRNVILAARFKQLRRWWRERLKPGDGEAEPMMVV